MSLSISSWLFFLIGSLFYFCGQYQCRKQLVGENHPLANLSLPPFLISTGVWCAIFIWYGINRVQITSPLSSLRLTSEAALWLLRVYVVCRLRALGHTQVLTVELEKGRNVHSLTAFSYWWCFRKGANFLSHIRSCEFTGTRKNSWL